MAENSQDQTFVVITGDPQKGHGARLSQARSHLARQYHGKKRSQNTKANTRQDHARQAQQVLALRRALQAVPPGIRLLLEPPPMPPSVPGVKRMQRFMYDYVHPGTGLHRFFLSIIYAAINHPALMSAKILSASAWDDLSKTEHISPITMQQSNITRELLNGSLTNEDQRFSDVTVAALLSVLLFDLVNFDAVAFENDRVGLDIIIKARGGIENLGFEGRLRESLILMDQFRRIGKSPLDSWKSLSPADFAVFPYAPVDMAAFTLGSPECDCSQSVNQALTDLYQSVLHFAAYTTSAKPVYEGYQYPTALTRPHMLLEQSDHSQQSNDDDPRIPVLDQARYLLNLSNSVSETDTSLAQGGSHLKYLLHRTNMDVFWGPLPGAMIWCLVIGARLAQPGSARKWFMMQIQRTCCAMAVETCERVLRCLRTVLVGLDGAQISRPEVSLMNFV